MRGVSNMNKQGWYNNSHNHRLASMGIKTKNWNVNVYKFNRKDYDQLLMRARDHRIFDEYYEDMATSNLMPTLEGYSLSVLESHKDNAEDYFLMYKQSLVEGDKQDAEYYKKYYETYKALVDNIEKGKYKEAWYGYLYDIPQHGEVAGDVVGTLVNEGDMKGAYNFLKMLDDQIGFGFDT